MTLMGTSLGNSPGESRRHTEREATAFSTRATSTRDDSGRSSQKKTVVESNQRLSTRSLSSNRFLFEVSRKYADSKWNDLNSETHGSKMPEQYAIDCPCGSSIEVQLFEAGTTRSCPLCRESVLVPSINELKQSRGDKYPMLSPLQKIEKCLAERESPFDGRCQACRNTDANWEIPLNFEYLVEREILGDDGGFGVGLGGLRPKVAKSIEHTQSTKFPLLLCDNCNKQFQKSRSSFTSKQLATNFLGIILLVVTVALMFSGKYFSMGIVLLVFTLAMLLYEHHVQQSSPVDSYLSPWLRSIDWVDAAVEDAMEARIEVGDALTFSHNENDNSPSE